VLLVASLGKAMAGHYNRAVVLCQVPFLLAGNSVRQVFFQRAAAIQAAGKPVDDLVEQVVDRLIWVTLLPLALLAVIGPELLTVVLGPDWPQAGKYAQLLACWLFLEGISMPLSGLISVLRILGAGLAFRASLVIGQIVSIVIGGWVLKSNFASVLLLACSGAAVHATMIVFMLRASGVPMRRAGGRLLRYLAYAAPTLAVAAAANWWLRLRDWQVVAAAAAASVSYVALVLRHDAWARERLWGILGRLVALADRALRK